jgi:hypothetical protein
MQSGVVVWGKGPFPRTPRNIINIILLPSVQRTVNEAGVHGKIEYENENEHSARGELAWVWQAASELRKEASSHLAS